VQWQTIHMGATPQISDCGVITPPLPRSWRLIRNQHHNCQLGSPTHYA